MTLQGNDFREAVRIVAIDPSAPYASGIRRALPSARIVVDHFHVVMLANKMVTDVRQRVSRDRHGRRGRKADPSWANRQLLLRAGDRLGDKARAARRAVRDRRPDR
jgi:transposase